MSVAETEIGFEMKMFSNRVNVDVAAIANLLPIRLCRRRSRTHPAS
jgi:hypothetical protein